MFKIYKFLFNFFTFSQAWSTKITFLSVLIALIEISFFISTAAAIELFLFGQDSGYQRLISLVYDNLKIMLTIEWLIAITLILSISSVILNYVLLFVIRQKILFLADIFQNKLWEIFTSRPLSFSLERSSRSDLKVFSESILVLLESTVFQTYLLLSKIIIMLIYLITGLLIGGVYFAFSAVLIMGFFSFSFMVYIYRIKTILKDINFYGEKRLRLLVATLNNRFDIVLYGYPKSLLSLFSQSIKILIAKKTMVMTEALKPRIMIEGLFFASISGAALYRIYNPELVLTQNFIIIFLIVLRLLPAIQQVSSGLRSATSVDWARHDIEKNASINNKLNNELNNNYLGPVISCNALFDSNENFSGFKVEIKSENNSKKEINLEKGRINILRGPSGIGKSSVLLSMIRTIQENTNFKENISDLVAYVPQNPVVFPCNFSDNIKMGTDKVRQNKYKDFRFSDFWIKRYNEKIKDFDEICSGGEAQRIAVMRALFQRKTFYFFDEPTSALDEKMANIVLNKIMDLCEKDVFIVIITHNKSPILNEKVMDIYI